MSEPTPQDVQPWNTPSFEKEREEFPDPENSETPEAEAAPTGAPGDFVPMVTGRGTLTPQSAPDFGEGFAEGPSSGMGTTGRDGEPDFAAMKFLRENTLLSNAEKYADSIREEAELYVARIRKEAEALNLETDLRYEEARVTKEKAEQEADALIAAAQEETEGIREEARKEGIAGGREEGIAGGREESAPYLDRLESVLQELGSYRRQVAYYAEKDAVRLAVLMAKQVLRQELKINRKAVWNLLAKTLSTLDGKGQFRIWINPDDYDFAKAARPSLERFIDEDQSLTLRSRPDVPPGNVQIETDREVIDLGFQNQFHYLEAVMNQAIAERETTVLKRPASAEPPIPKKSPGPPLSPTDESTDATAE